MIDSNNNLINSNDINRQIYLYDSTTNPDSIFISANNMIIPPYGLYDYNIHFKHLFMSGIGYNYIEPYSNSIAPIPYYVIDDTNYKLFLTVCIMTDTITTLVIDTMKMVLPFTIIWAHNNTNGDNRPGRIVYKYPNGNTLAIENMYNQTNTYYTYVININSNGDFVYNLFDLKNANLF